MWQKNNGKSETEILQISLRRIWQLQYSAAGTIIYSSRTGADRLRI